MAKKGDFVAVSYTGKIKGTGEIFDLTDEKLAKEKNIHRKGVVYGPVPIIVGTGKLPEELDTALLEMSVGDKKKILVDGSKLFGKRDEKLQQVLPEKFFKEKKISPKVGTTVQFVDQNGVPVFGKIKTVSAGRVTIDLNHPLAGQELEYELKVEQALEQPEEQVKSLLRHHLNTETTFSVRINKDSAEIAIPAGMLVEPRGMKHVADEVLTHCKIKTVKFTYTFEKEDNGGSEK